jgi:hypothetical protein
MDKVQKHNSFNTNTPSSESYRNHLLMLFRSNRIVRLSVYILQSKMVKERLSKMKLKHCKRELRKN